jgi:type IV pilus assembly protein PilB
MFEDHTQTLQDLLIERGVLPADQVEAVSEEMQRTGMSLVDALIVMKIASKDQVLSSIAEALGWEYLQQPPAMPPITADILPAETARMYGVLPYRVGSNTVDLLCKDPFNSQIVDDLTFALGRDVRLVVTDPEAIDPLIKARFGEDDETIEHLLDSLGDAQGLAERELSANELEEAANQTPIVRFVNLVLAQAVRDKASDIHFEPFEDEFKIRYRIDGALYEMAPPPRNLAIPIISRVKVIAALNIAERRLPQDGRIKLTISGRQVDLRVSTLPTQFGESVVLRVLDQSATQLKLETLGMTPEVFEGVTETIKRPNGIFIVTGPTGSGKTTTLYSCLRVVNSPELKLLTAEDPVEYEIEGIMQVPINHHVGLTFGAALRAFLRQDPDIIMVGEIRDLETAQIAIQASLTGHLVLSTLHTNDAPGAITRLIDMGVEPFLLASSVEAVLAQRLVRRICKKCRTAYEPSSTLLAQLGINPVDIGDREFFYGKGCEQCNSTGYKGRMGIYEFLRVTDAIRDLITSRAPSLVMRQKAVEQGMKTLREDGLRAIFDGETTIEEVIKYS